MHLIGQATPSGGCCNPAIILELGFFRHARADALEDICWRASARADASPLSLRDGDPVLSLVWR
jgi:hypothetical protein